MRKTYRNYAGSVNMNKFQQICMRRPSTEDITSIKELLKSGALGNDWENYYWCGKCLCAYDRDDININLLIDIFDSAIKNGLSHRANRYFFIDTIKALATLNSRIRKYDAVLNYLNTILEWDTNSPDWVYHDFVSAQIHTGSIRRILKNPGIFLSDLKHNDSNSDQIKNKQRKIFREFLIESVKWMCNNPNNTVDYNTIAKAASGYDLVDTNIWQYFTDAVNGRIPPNIDSILEKDAEKERTTTKDIDDRPLIISIFPENESIAGDTQQQVNAEMKEKLSDALFQLETAEKKLLQRENDLSEKAQQIKDLKAKYEELKQTTNSKMADQNTLQERIRQACDENDALKAEINTLKNSKDAALKKAATDPVTDIVSHMHIFLYSTQVALASWLNSKLPHCDRDWWEQCVMNSLSYEQLERAHDSRKTTLREFDLAALLRIMSRNFAKLKVFTNLDSEDRACLTNMFLIRNSWAHLNIALLDKNNIKKDLDTVQKFMKAIDCPKQTEVSNYVLKVNEMYI